MTKVRKSIFYWLACLILLLLNLPIAMLSARKCLAISLITVLAICPFSTAQHLQRLPPVNGIASNSAALTLENAIWTAQQRNQRMGAAACGIGMASSRRAAVASRNEANFSVLASYSLFNDAPQLVSSQFGGVTRIPLSDDHLGAVAGAVTLPVYRGGKSHEEWQSASADVELSRLGHRLDERSLRMDVIRAFAQVLIQQSHLQLAEIELLAATALEQKAANEANAGASTEIDRMALTAARSAANTRFEVSRNELEDARGNLNHLLARPLDESAVLAVPDLPYVDEDCELWVMKGLASREELGSLRYRIDQARHDAESVRRDGHPHVYMHGLAGVNNNDFIAPDAFGELGLSMNWNVFDGGRRKNEAAARKIEARKLRYQIEEAKSKIRLEIQSAFRARRIAYDRLRTSQTQLEYEFARNGTALKQQELGMLTPAEMLASEAKLAAARHVYNLELMNALVTSHYLRFVAGQ